MSIIEDIKNKSLWEEFYLDRESNSFIDERFLKYLRKYIDDEKYLKYYNEIKDCSFYNYIPFKKEREKPGSTSKRIIYYYRKPIQTIFKFIEFQLRKYDSLFAPNLYSFRSNNIGFVALRKISKIINKQNYYVYKVDVSNYFNSIDQNILFDELDKEIDDKELIDFFKKILTKKTFIFNNKEIHEECGAMAGLPISVFLSNFYLKEMDKYFYNHKINYFRYADDILILSNTNQEYEDNKKYVKDYLSSRKLGVNPKKEIEYKLCDNFEFLGFDFFNNGDVDVSNSTFNKIKKRIRKDHKALELWARKKHFKKEDVNIRATKGLINKYNKKFFSKENSDLCWIMWYFPIIKIDKTIKKIDEFMQEHLRALYTGQYKKSNYKKCPYIKLKEMGYKSLVNEYYKFISKDKILIEEESKSTE